MEAILEIYLSGLNKIYNLIKLQQQCLYGNRKLLIEQFKLQKFEEEICTPFQFCAFQCISSNNYVDEITSITEHLETGFVDFGLIYFLLFH